MQADKSRAERRRRRRVVPVLYFFVAINFPISVFGTSIFSIGVQLDSFFKRVSNISDKLTQFVMFKIRYVKHIRVLSMRSSSRHFFFIAQVG